MVKSILGSIIQIKEDNETPPFKIWYAIWDGGVASGVRYPGNWIHSTPEMPPSFFLLSRNICWDGAGHVTVALLIDAMWDNKLSSIFQYGGLTHEWTPSSWHRCWMPFTPSCHCRIEWHTSQGIWYFSYGQCEVWGQVLILEFLKQQNWWVGKLGKDKILTPS